MTTFRRSRRRFSSHEKRELVRAWRASGESQNRFAHDHGIAPSYLSRWSRKDDPDEESRLIAVRVTDTSVVTSDSSAGFEVRLPSGAEISVPRGFDAASLTSLLSALRVAGC